MDHCPFLQGSRGGRGNDENRPIPVLGVSALGFLEYFDTGGLVTAKTSENLCHDYWPA